jgi:hypothetical protein
MVRTNIYPKQKIYKANQKKDAALTPDARLTISKEFQFNKNLRSNF